MESNNQPQRRAATSPTKQTSGDADHKSDVRCYAKAREAKPQADGMTDEVEINWDAARAARFFFK